MSLVGTTVDRVRLTVERGKVLEMARATHAEDEVHRDPRAALRAGAKDALATATHVVVVGHHRDQAGVVARLGLRMARVVVGSVSWDYARPLVVGDALVGVRTVIADETRPGTGGGLRLVTLETAWTDQHGDVAVRQREVLIERGDL